MSTHLDPTDLDPIEAEHRTIPDPLTEAREHVAAAASLRERVRARHSELQRGIVLEVPIPGYDGDLVAVFPRIPFAEVKRIGLEVDRKKRKSDKAELYACADVLLTQCIEVLLKGEGEQRFPVTQDGERCGLGRDLALALGIPHASELDDMQALFVVLGKAGDAGALGMFDEVMSWSRGVSRDVRERLEGESPATRT